MNPKTNNTERSPGGRFIDQSMLSIILVISLKDVGSLSVKLAAVVFYFVLLFLYERNKIWIRDQYYNISLGVSQQFYTIAEWINLGGGLGTAIGRNKSIAQVPLFHQTNSRLSSSGFKYLQFNFITQKAILLVTQISFLIGLRYLINFSLIILACLLFPEFARDLIPGSIFLQNHYFQ